MLRIVISGVAALAVGLAGGWTFLTATDVEASPTTAPATASLGWPHFEPLPPSDADAAASPAPTGVPVPTSARGIHITDVPTRTLAPAAVAGPQAKPAAAVMARDKPRNRMVRRRESDDDDE
jgi:hypothetical protein